MLTVLFAVVLPSGGNKAPCLDTDDSFFLHAYNLFRGSLRLCLWKANQIVLQTRLQRSTLMKKIIVCLSWLFLATACDKVTDLQPQSILPLQEGVPQAVVAAARQTFPQLKTATFAPVGKDQTWRVDFEANGAYIAFFSTQGTFYNAYRQIAETNLTPVIRLTLQNQGASVQTAFEDLSVNQAVEGYVTQLRTAQQTASTAYFDALGGMLFTYAGATPLLTTASAATDYSLYLIPPADLPDKVKTYVSQTYNGSTISKSAISVANGVKQYLVYGSVSGVAFELYFNEAGTVIKTMIYQPAPSGQDGTVTQANLPASTIAWLNQNYPSWTFQKGAKSTTTINLVIGVGKTTYSLLFDLNWNFTSARSVNAASSGSPGTPSASVALKAANLPDSVKELLNQTYPGWVFREGNKTADLITILLEVNGRYSLTFDTTWKLLKTTKIG